MNADLENGEYRQRIESSPISAEAILRQSNAEYVSLMKRHGFLLTVFLCAIITVAACALAEHDNALHVNALHFLQAAVLRCAAIGAVFSIHAHPSFIYAFAATAILLIAVSRTLRIKSRRLFARGIILALAAQLVLIDRFLWDSPKLPIAYPFEWQLAIPLGAVLYLLAVLAIRRSLIKEPDCSVLERKPDDSRRFTLLDSVVLLTTVCAALLLRVYALNYIFDYFEGELSPYAAGGTSLTGMLYANQGYYGPWAPLGLLYYLPIYLTTKLFGVNLLALRLSSALVGVLTVPLVYLCAARLAGKAAGHIAAVLFTLDVLHIGWSRTDIHPHGVTTWPTLLMCWCLLNAYDTRRLSWACGVAFMMGLSWHQYPSGQSAVMIPLAAAGIFWIQNRFTLPLRWGQLFVVGIGVALWFLGLPLCEYLVSGHASFANPFTLTGPRALWGEQAATVSTLQAISLVAGKALQHLGHVIQGLFYRVPFLFHQEWVPYTDGFFPRTIAWMEMPFVVAGLCVLLVHRKKFESAVIIAWLIAAVLPGILSETAYPKRFSTLFPALDIVAAIGLASLLQWMSTSLPDWRRVSLWSAFGVTAFCAFCFQTHFWFSGKFWKYGEAPEIRMANAIAGIISRDTVVVAYLGGGYESGKLTFLLLDHLTDPENRPNLIIFPRVDRAPSVFADPITEGQASVKTSWWYIWTKLRSQVPETLIYHDWKKVVWLIIDFNDGSKLTSELVALAASQCPNPQKEEFSRSGESQSGNPYIIRGFMCQVSDLKKTGGRISEPR